MAGTEPSVNLTNIKKIEDRLMGALKQKIIDAPKELKLDTEFQLINGTFTFEEFLLAVIQADGHQTHCRSYQLAYIAAMTLLEI